MASNDSNSSSTPPPVSPKPQSSPVICDLFKSSKAKLPTSPSQSNNELFPDWVHNLLAYFSFKGKTEQKVAEKGKNRIRYNYTLECNLCKESEASPKTKKAKQGPITGYCRNNFQRHLEVTGFTSQL